jgi:hypothetical protein
MKHMQTVKSFLFIIILIIFSSSGIRAQYIEQVEEITAGNFFGFGARQMGMGGAGMMSFDGSALFYNPANLARIPRIEASLGLSHQEYTDKSSIRDVRRIVDYTGVTPTDQFYQNRFAGFTPVSGSADASKSNTRLNSAILTVPYPTYRGSLVFGFGMAHVANFDRVFTLSHYDSASPGNIIRARGDEFQTGGLTQWGAGAGIDLSPRISFGLSIFIYTGKHDYNWRYRLDSLPDLQYGQEDYITDKYFGWNFKPSLAIQMNQYVSMALAFETPLNMSVKEDVSTTYDGDPNIYIDDVEYDVKRPFVFSGGMALSLNEATLAIDVDYTDWTQLEYKNNIAMERYNDEIKAYYDKVFRYRIGGEYVLPALGLSLRGGYFVDPLPIKKQFIDDNRDGFSLGFGILIDRVMTIDVAWVHAGYKRNSDFIYASTYNASDELTGTHNLIVDEDISYDRIYVTSAYRF